MLPEPLDALRDADLMELCTAGKRLRLNEADALRDVDGLEVGTVLERCLANLLEGLIPLRSACTASNAGIPVFIGR